MCGPRWSRSAAGRASEPPERGNAIDRVKGRGVPESHVSGLLDGVVDRLFVDVGDM